MAALTFDMHHYIKNLQAKGFSEEQAEALMEVISESRTHDMPLFVAKTELTEFKSEMRTDFTTLEARMDIKFSEMDNKIAEAKFEIIKWMFGGFLTMAVLILGLFFKLP